MVQTCDDECRRLAHGTFIFKYIQGGPGDRRGWPRRLKYTTRGTLIYIYVSILYVYVHIINIIVARPCTNRFSGARRHNCVAQSAGRRPRDDIYFHYFLSRAPVAVTSATPAPLADRRRHVPEVSKGYSRPVPEDPPDGLKDDSKTSPIRI